jgi:hypothetical protein
MDHRTCIRCEESPAVDEDGYCGHCHWVVRTEIEEGFYQLREYLLKWARFEAWCSEHPTVPLNADHAPIAIAAAEQLRWLRAADADAA